MPALSSTVVFAKIPAPGTVKTRIAATHGQATALSIYKRLLRHTALALAPVSHHVAFAGAKSPAGLRRIFRSAESFFAQTGRGLGTRLKNAFTHLAGAGIEHICAVGCDCPDLLSGDIHRALGLLNQGCDVVIGPAEDGGYYLISCRAPCVDIFDVEGWSSPRLLENTIAVCKRRGYRYALLHLKYDIDTMADVERWRRDLSAR
jgi:rSAM/selenodomain-associated transferase 1